MVLVQSDAAGIVHILFASFQLAEHSSPSQEPPPASHFSDVGL